MIDILPARSTSSQVRSQPNLQQSHPPTAGQLRLGVGLSSEGWREGEGALAVTNHENDAPAVNQCDHLLSLMLAAVDRTF
jgi:hypothetical protein